MAKVFFMTVMSCLTCVGLLNRVANHLSPTNSHWERLSGAR
jgi:hypothetical protein